MSYFLLSARIIPRVSASVCHLKIQNMGKNALYFHQVAVLGGRGEGKLDG